MEQPRTYKDEPSHSNYPQINCKICKLPSFCRKRMTENYCVELLDSLASVVDLLIYLTWQFAVYSKCEVERSEIAQRI